MTQSAQLNTAMDTQDANTFNIKVGEFQGSLEALLEMVQKRKLNISDVSLARVADDYVAYVKSLEGRVGALPNTETASFIVIAATLLLIKSKSLLPTLELSMEEEEDIKGLEERLQLYSIYKQASDALTAYTKSGARLYAPRHMQASGRIIFAPANNLSLQALSEAMADVLGQLPKVSNKPKAEIRETIHIKEVMRSLLARVEGAAQHSFNVESGNNREDVLVNFLALLELVKDGVLLAEQEHMHGDIVMSSSV